MDENHSLNRQKRFWVPPLFRKAAFLEAFWKKPHQKLLFPFHQNAARTVLPAA
ncbi:hypothetical protein SXCC_03924 [Gluconacetobacter sp. SXCC-1]|nr:hypothetical protein SXCC_03924 [Gluconacetobacter sp. SXCC-1]